MVGASYDDRGALLFFFWVSPILELNNKTSPKKRKMKGKMKVLDRLTTLMA